MSMDEQACKVIAERCKLNDRRKARRLRAKESIRKWLNGRFVYFKNGEPTTKKAALEM